MAFIVSTPRSISHGLLDSRNLLVKWLVRIPQHPGRLWEAAGDGARDCRPAAAVAVEKASRRHCGALRRFCSGLGRVDGDGEKNCPLHLLVAPKGAIGARAGANRGVYKDVVDLVEETGVPRYLRRVLSRKLPFAAV